VLEAAKEAQPALVTKTSLMLGLGETDEEIMQTMKGGTGMDHGEGARCMCALLTAAAPTTDEKQSCARLGWTA
jgi:hypothetical protein